MNLNREIQMAELHNIHAETAKLQAEAARLNAETFKLQEEGLKIQKETRYYPAVSIVIALIALGASLLALLK